MPNPADTASYQQYVGDYQLLSTIAYKVRLVDGKLMWTLRGRQLELVPEDEHTFVMDGAANITGFVLKRTQQGK